MTAETAVRVEDLIAGTYALYHKVEGKIYHFQVDKPTKGRWAGYTFLSRVTGDNALPIRDRKQREQILNAIARNPIEAAALFGTTTGTCGICHRQLTVEESVERGIGPVCYAKLGGC